MYSLEDLLGNKTESCTAIFENTATIYDDKAPVIHDVRITPVEFDTTDTPVTITFDLDITDDIVGVANISIGLVPVVEGYMGSYWFDEVTKIAGSVTNGTFRLQVELHKGAPIGFWRVNNIDVEDALGRSQRYTTSILSLTFPNLPLYLVNQGTADEVTLEGDWTLENWPYWDEENVVWPDISVRFSKGTTIRKEKGGVFAFHRMLATKYNLGDGGLDALLSTVNTDYAGDLKDCAVAEGCEGTTVNKNTLNGSPLHILKFGIPGLNLIFSKPVTIVIGVESKFLGETFVLQTFDESQEKWVNLGSCTVKTIVPPSTEHGGDQYGIIKPVPYAGCEFTTDHASFFSINDPHGEVKQLPGVPNTGFGGTASLFAE